MIFIILIAVSLSMDAFSISLAYGTNKIILKKRIIISIIVGIFHFIMPLIGNSIGNVTIKNINFNPNYIASIIFVYLSIDMFIESLKNEDSEIITSFIKILLFALAVSIDSFSVGLTLFAITDKYLLTYTIFSVFAFLFTFIGLLLGRILNDKFGKYAKIFGSIVLFILSIIYLLT